MKGPAVQYYVGVDLGQAQDYTAICVVEHSSTEHAYLVRHIERCSLGTPYPEIADRVVSYMRSPQLRGAALVLDATGVGRPVVDMLLQQRIYPVSVLITAGTTTTQDVVGFWHVPKRDLVGALQVLLQTRRLRVAGQLPYAKALVDELLAFRVKVNTATGGDSYEAWRERDHDDMVLSVALACWYGLRQNADAHWVAPRVMSVAAVAEQEAREIEMREIAAARAAAEEADL